MSQQQSPIQAEIQIWEVKLADDNATIRNWENEGSDPFSCPYEAMADAQEASHLIELLRQLDKDWKVVGAGQPAKLPAWNTFKHDAAKNTAYNDALARMEVALDILGKDVFVRLLGFSAE